MMELAKAIRNRRSIRKYLDKDVPDELLVQAFELARWAPSGGNFQSWKFLVVKNRKIINKVANAFQEKVDTFTNWPEAEEYRETAESYRKNAPFFREAPVLIVALSCGYKSVADLILSKKGKKDPLAMQMMENRRSAPTSIQQIGGFIGHLLLVLHSLGLGACWMSGPLIAKEEIEEILGIPQGEDLVACIPVGYPAEKPPAKPRKTVDELVVFLR